VASPPLWGVPMSLRTRRRSVAHASAATGTGSILFDHSPLRRRPLPPRRAASRWVQIRGRRGSTGWRLVPAGTAVASFAFGHLFVPEHDAMVGAQEATGHMAPRRELALTRFAADVRARTSQKVMRDDIVEGHSHIPSRTSGSRTRVLRSGAAESHLLALSALPPVTETPNRRPR